jgi:hypothetical protein
MKTKLSALCGVIIGIALLLMGGGGAPPWLCNVQAALFCSLALLYGFSAFTPSAPAWLSSRPVMGIASVYMGVAVMLVPANIVTSAFFLGLGIRLLMAERPKARVVEPPRGDEPGTAIRRGAADIILHQSGQIVTRD